MYETSHFTVVEYIDVLGRSSYRDWLTDLHVSVRARIQARIFRIESGNLGKCRDIRQAKEYWSAWQEGERDGQKKP